MKKEALNPVKERGFQSKAQMRLLLNWARKHPDKYNWVFDVLKNHGVPAEDGPLHTYWTGPYNISPETPSYTYTGGKTSNMNLEQFVKYAKQKVAGEGIIDFNLAKEVANQFWAIRGQEFSPEMSPEEMLKFFLLIEEFRPFQQLDSAAQEEVRRFVGDKMLGRDVKTSSLEKVVKVAYINHVVRLFEGKSNKFSSIDEALNDFSERLGLNQIELASLKKEAMVKVAQLRQLEDEGITDPKAINYMSKAKGKHTENSGSPFVLNTEKGKKLERKLKQKKDLMAPEFEEQDQANEFGDNATSDGSGNSFAAQVKRLQRYAQEFGKILPFKEPSKEAVEDLKSELGVVDIDTPFKASRFGFNFTDLDGNFPQPGRPIKVTTYQYSFLKDELIRLINEDLRNHLAKEMNFNDWIKFLEQQIQGKQLPHTEGWALVDKLEKMKRQLYGDEKTRPFLIDEGGKRLTQQIKKMMSWFPVSYRRQILNMLAAGKYRHILSEASGREHSGIFPTSYRRASFILMDSFSPFKAITFSPDKDKRRALLEAVVTNKKSEYSNEEFKQLLDSVGIEYSEVPASREYQVMPLHSKVKIKVGNAQNQDYKPLMHEKATVDVSDKEKLLADFHDRLFGAIKQDAPLAYEQQPDGSIKEMRLKDLGQSKKDFTLESESARTGFHPTYEGEIQYARPKGLGLGLTRRKQQRSPTPTPEAPIESKRDSFEDLLQKLREKKKGSAIKIIEKYAQSSGLWMDAQGRSFDSEQEMTNAMYKEMMESGMNDVISQAVDSVLSEVETISEPEQPQQVPSPPQEEPLVQEEDRLPLAANLEVRKILALLKLNRR